MWSRIVIVIVVIGALVFLGIPVFFKIETVLIKKANIEADVQNAVGKGDYALKGLNENRPLLWLRNDSIEKIVHDKRYIQKFGLKPIKHTSDIIMFKTEMEYNDAAYEYAQKYNERLVRELIKLGK